MEIITKEFIAFRKSLVADYERFLFSLSDEELAEFVMRNMVVTVTNIVKEALKK